MNESELSWSPDDALTQPALDAVSKASYSPADGIQRDVYINVRIGN